MNRIMNFGFWKNEGSHRYDGDAAYVALREKKDKLLSEHVWEMNKFKEYSQKAELAGKNADRLASMIGKLEEAINERIKLLDSQKRND